MSISSGWWFGTRILFVYSVGNFIIPTVPTDKLIFFRGVGSSIDWFKGKITGKSHISWENLWFPVDFPLNQPIDINIPTFQHWRIFGAGLEVGESWHRTQMPVMPVMPVRNLGGLGKVTFWKEQKYEKNSIFLDYNVFSCQFRGIPSFWMFGLFHSYMYIYIYICIND